MPYPSTPLVGTFSPSSSVGFGGHHQPSHRTTPAPVSCMRTSLGASSSSPHHLHLNQQQQQQQQQPRAHQLGSSTNRRVTATLARAGAVAPSESAVSEEGFVTTGAAGSTLPVMSTSPSWNLLFGIGAPYQYRDRAFDAFGEDGDDDDDDAVVTTRRGSKGVGRDRAPSLSAGEGPVQRRGGLRISDLPPFVMARSDSNESDASSGDSLNDGGESGARASLRWSLTRQRTPTPFSPSEKDNWLDEAGEA